MTASPPQVNGHKRPTMPVLGDWQSVAPEPVEEQRTPEPPAESDAVAEAQAAAIRARSYAETEAIRVAAEAEAKAKIAKAEEDARKLRLANDKAEARAQEEQAARDARIAKHHKDRRDAEHAEAEAVKERAEAQQAEAEQQAKRDKTANVWMWCALGFAIACAVVALPVQMSAFWNPKAWWLLAAPLMLEGGAWVVLQGARAAVDDRRPHWHYRLIAWTLAFIAAGINLWHGMHAFDPATAIGTAFASIAGPGVWDLHEHGRIRKRDGVLTRRERKAQRKTDRAETARKTAEEKRLAAEKAAADKAAEERRQTLLEERQREFPKVWAEAVKIGAALGKAPDDPAVWPRAYRNIEGCEPGESIESITSRRKAEARIESALTGTPVNTLSKTTSAQRAVQTPRSSYKPVPPRRTPGDTPRYSRAAGRAHGDLLRRKNARQKDQ